MQKIEVDSIRRVFLKGNTEKPDWENLLTLDMVVERSNAELPDNRYEAQHIREKVRQGIYGSQRYEIQENGRILISYKVQGCPVLYGYTKKVKYIENYMRRKNKAIQNQTRRLSGEAIQLKAICPKLQLTLFDRV